MNERTWLTVYNIIWVSYNDASLFYLAATTTTAYCVTNKHQWHLSLRWFNFNASMDKVITRPAKYGKNYLSISKLQVYVILSHTLSVYAITLTS